MAAHGQWPKFAVVLAGALTFVEVRHVSSTETPDSWLEGVYVSATKLNVDEIAHEVPFSITTFSAEQLEDVRFRDLSSLSYLIPNVQLDEISVAEGTANFSIRGLGINSSIPSIDPTVGVFVDGVYLGVTAGVVLDMFDLESVETLRGPQGVLFGRNVTGGAVLVNTRDPDDTYSLSTKLALESRLHGTGNNYYGSGSVTGPIADTLAGRLAVFVNDDGGWHKNRFDGEDFGEADAIIVRPGLKYTPSPDLEFILKYEHGKDDADGPAAQHAGLFDTDSFDFSVNERGFANQDWDQVTLETNFDVAFGAGTFTNVFGWRDYSLEALVDVDATPRYLSHSAALLDQHQYSDEFRYTGRFFERLSLTAGVHYFTQHFAYQETRSLPFTAATRLGFPSVFEGGGIQDQDTWGVFASLDYDIVDNITLTAGGRYTREEKSVDVASLNANISRLPAALLASGQAVFPFLDCDVLGERCAFDFSDEESWSSFTPKVGLQWWAFTTTQIYGFWTRGFRSGGYNLRNSDPTIGPGPFDQESMDTYEIGLKHQSENGRFTGNIALFWNDIHDLQREVNTPGVSGIVQVIRNTADATIRGVEIETRFALTETLILTPTMGYVDGEYDEVIFDLNNDGMVDAADESLDIPRLAPWTYGVGIHHDHPLANIGTIKTALQYSHRDAAAYTDDNRGQLREADMIDASIGIRSTSGNWTGTLFAKNLLNESTVGGDSQTPFGSGIGIGTRPLGTFSPLNIGRVFGVELVYRF